ncbi:MAG: zinc ABC transporter substrate-binding protein [Chloroflexota bacterium]
MLTKIKYLSIFTIFTLFLLLTTQCGGQPADAPAAADKAAAAGQEVGEEKQVEARQPEADEHEAEATELAPIDLADGQKLKVVATTSIVADLVKNVGGDLIELQVLLPIGTDPHSFEPTPGDLATIAEAHLIFANGMGLEEFLNEMLKNAGGGAALVEVSNGIEPRQMSQAEAQAHEAEEEEEHADEHEGADPHTWTTPNNALIFVHNIEHALSALDPANAKTYADHATTYEAELEQLDAWVKTQIQTIPAENRELVTDHTIFGYYADRYGLTQIGAIIPSFSTTAEQSAQELAGLEEIIKQQGVKAVFVGNTVNPGLEQRVAEDTGTKLVQLYSDSLGPEGSGVETYVDYIKYNTHTIVDSLK